MKLGIKKERKGGVRKKLLFIVLILIFSLNGIGCEGINRALKEKFVRKKKEKDEKEVIKIGERETYPNEVRYKMHYVYWDAWMTELINYLGVNHKKDVGNCRRALENLEKMADFLKPEKALLLQPYIEELARAKGDLVSGRVNTDVDAKMLKRKINRLSREVRREFAPYKLDKNWIKPDIEPDWDVY